MPDFVMANASCLYCRFADPNGILCPEPGFENRRYYCSSGVGGVDTCIQTIYGKFNPKGEYLGRVRYKLHATKVVLEIKGRKQG